MLLLSRIFSLCELNYTPGELEPTPCGLEQYSGETASTEDGVYAACESPLGSPRTDQPHKAHQARKARGACLDRVSWNENPGEQTRV